MSFTKEKACWLQSPQDPLHPSGGQSCAQASMREDCSHARIETAPPDLVDDTILVNRSGRHVVGGAALQNLRSQASVDQLGCSWHTGCPIKGKAISVEH